MKAQVNPRIGGNPPRGRRKPAEQTATDLGVRDALLHLYLVPRPWPRQPTRRTMPPAAKGLLAPWISRRLRRSQSEDQVPPELRRWPHLPPR